jgi:hypothetical protein
MQKIATLFIAAISTLLLFSSFQPATPTLTGAWGYGPADNRTVMICSGNVFSVATYDITGKKFSSSYGGTWQVTGNQLLQKIEWNSADSTTVGKEFTHPIRVTNQQLTIGKQTWDKLDDGGPGQLAGAWIITGTYNNDKVSKRASPFFPRRTMKVLSGKYFHWIAYHITNKQFINAGGGTYTTVNGKYTENIEFFTKTAESVGKSLSFDYSFVNGDWRHRGEKSTGGPMDECWTRRETLEK